MPPMRRMNPIVVCLVATFALPLGCKDEPAPLQPPSEPEPAATGSSTELTESDKVKLMEQHYELAIVAHDQLIRGNLREFRSKLSSLAAEELPSHAPSNWTARHQLMRDAAKRAADADDVEAAGRGMASVLQACGTCHSVHVQGPIYGKPEAPKGTNPLKTKMLNHQWATERLWEGVTGPRDDSWARGAKALAETQTFADDDQVAASLRELESALRAQGKEATKVTNLPKRAELYGRLLAGCAKCHDEAKVPFEGKAP